jgi:hypothetical protein
VNDTYSVLIDIAKLEQADWLDTEYLHQGNYDELSDQAFVNRMFELDDLDPDFLGYLFH